MTEKSWFWDGTATGDSSYAPYNAQEFNTWVLSSFLSDNLDKAYIVPGYLDNLWVRSAGVGVHSVVVNTGAAVFDNYVYILDSAITLPITQVGTGDYRKDIVVLRLNLGTNKIRLAVIEGSPAASLSSAAEPALTQTGAIYEVALAVVYVDGTSYIIDSYVHDQRRFLYNAFTGVGYGAVPKNLARNGEWLAFSGSGTTYFPDEWTPVAGGVSNSRTTGTVGSGRGDYAVSVGFTTSAGMRQYIVVHGKTFTVKASLAILSGTTHLASISLYGLRSNGVLSSVSGQWYESINSLSNKEILFTVTFPEDDIEKLYLETIVANNIAEIIVVPGFHAGGYRPIPEIIPFTKAVPDASWTATAKSTGTTTIDFTASFSAFIKNYTKAVVLRLRGRDSGSAAAASCYLRARGYAAPYNAVYGHLEISGVTNDVWRETVAIVPVDQIYFGTGTAGAQLRLDIVATGAATFDATVEVVGIII